VIKATLSELFKYLITVWFVVTVVFMMLRWLPNNIVIAQYIEAGLEVETLQIRLDELGLNQPLNIQYVEYWLNLAGGNLGRSLANGQPVSRMLAQRLPVSLSMLLPSFALAIPLGVGLGILMNQRGGIFWRSLVDLTFMMPIYWTGTLVLFGISGQFNIPQSDIRLPTGVLAFHIMGAIARITYTSYSHIRQETFIQFAKAKGLPAFLVTFRHILKPVMIPVLSVVAVQFGVLLGATVITESIFSKAGLGTMLLQGVLNRDYAVVQAVVIVLVSVFLLVRLIINSIIRWIDPRVSP
jgi:peptide/nickel transport system permease protein